MSPLPTNDDLCLLQRQITEGLQKRVLNNLDGNYRRDLESTAFSIELLDRLHRSKPDSYEPMLNSRL